MPVLRTFTVGGDFAGWKAKHIGVGHTVFLAGPIERVPPYGIKLLPKWRDEALLFLNASRPDIVVFNPEWEDRPYGWTYEKQVMWEVEHTQKADTIMFWIPRQLPTLPAFTTNIEFGEWLHSDKIVIGSPPTSAHMDYLRLRCEMRRLPWHHTLQDCCAAVVDRARKDQYLSLEEAIYAHQ